MRRLVVTAIMALAVFASLQANGASTSFPLTENPISEGGKWINGKAQGLDWSNVATTPGLAFGTQTGSGGYNDSIAILAGSWGPNQSATATVHSINQVGGNTFQEVEILLRWTIGAHVAKGYEINFRALKSSESYTQIVRWNGPLGNYTLLDSRGGLNYGIKDGDVVKATIVGNVITGYINGVQVIQGTDSVFTTGNPGVGFFLRGAGVNSDFGFSRFTASDGTTQP
jgi:hypothetical protein